MLKEIKCYTKNSSTCLHNSHFLVEYLSCWISFQVWICTPWEQCVPCLPLWGQSRWRWHLHGQFQGYESPWNYYERDVWETSSEPAYWEQPLDYICSSIALHICPAKNIGLQFDYLLERSFAHHGVLQLEDVEVVYPDVVFDGYGVVKEDPIHCVIDEAYPNKVLQASKFTPSGLRGLLKLFLPPYTAASPLRRKQQQIAIIGAIGKYLLYHLWFSLS